MAGFLSRTLTLTLTRGKLSSAALLFPRKPAAPITTAIPFDNSYCQRNFSYKAQLIEIDLDSSSTDGSGEIHVKSSTSSSDDDERAEVPGMNKLEDAIHMITVQRCAPDWLPFVPGSCYWVPPGSNNIVQLVGKLTNPLTEEESLSLTTLRGWPCTSFLMQGNVSQYQGPMAVKVQLLMDSRLNKVSESEDED